MRDTDKTIREQVVDDVTMAIGVCGEILSKIKTEDGEELYLDNELFLTFLGIILNHIHYVFDQVGYIKPDEKIPELKVT